MLWIFYLFIFIFVQTILQVAFGETLTNIMDSRRQHEHITAVEYVNNHTLIDILDHYDSKAILFPEGFVLRENEMFEAAAYNAEVILSENTFESYATKNESATYVAISFGTPITVESGLRYNIDYQGVCDIALIKTHLMIHLAKVPKYWVFGEIMVHLFISCSDEILREIEEFCSNQLKLSNGKQPVLKQWFCDFPTLLPMNETFSGLAKL